MPAGTPGCGRRLRWTRAIPPRTRTTAITPTIATAARLRPAAGWLSGEFDGGVAAAPGTPEAPGSTLGLGATPDQPWGSGPTGAGSGPWRTGACAPTDPSHACWNAAVSSPS